MGITRATIKPVWNDCAKEIAHLVWSGSSIVWVVGIFTDQTVSRQDFIQWTREQTKYETEFPVHRTYTSTPKKSELWKMIISNVLFLLDIFTDTMN